MRKDIMVEEAKNEGGEKSQANKRMAENFLGVIF
jgi:hypothetical protein